MTPESLNQPQVDHNTERLAVVETRTNAMEHELLRVRERLHDLEGDRATLRLLVRQVSDMATNIQQIAERAADVAIEKAFDKRSEVSRKTRSLYVAYLSAGVAAGGLIATLITTIHR